MDVSQILDLNPMESLEGRKETLVARIAIMLENGQIFESKSKWCSPIKLVPFPDRINAFLEEHKE